MKMGSMLGAVALCAAGLGGAVGTANAGVLDQAQEVHGASFNMDASVLEWQQEVTVGLAGLLTQIDVYVSTPGSSTFYVNAGAPWQGDANDFEMLFVGDVAGWHSIDVSSAGLNFNVGDKFVIGWDNIDGGLWMGGHFISGGDPYPAGDLFLNGAPHTPGNEWDLAFRTYVIPTPAAVALLGLAGLAGPSRRRR